MIKLKQIEAIKSAYIFLSQDIGTDTDLIAADSTLQDVLALLLAKIVATRSSVAQTIADLHIDSIGFQGVASRGLAEGNSIRVGSEFVVDQEISGTTLHAEVGDYLICKTAFTVGTLTTTTDREALLQNFVIVEQNLTNALTLVSGGAAESGKYISAVTQNSHTLQVTKADLPFKSLTNTTGTDMVPSGAPVVTGVSLSNGVLTVTSRQLLEYVPAQVSADDQNISSGILLEACHPVVAAGAQSSLYNSPAVQVYQNGVLLATDCYTLNRNYTTQAISVVFTSAFTKNQVSSGDIFTVVYPAQVAYLHAQLTATQG